jgi:hypothetical protein
VTSTSEDHGPEEGSRSAALGAWEAREVAAAGAAPGGGASSAVVAKTSSQRSLLSGTGTIKKLFALAYSTCSLHLVEARVL